MVTGILLGIGIAGFVDESVFHQLLHWHAFYYVPSADVRLVSDGAFHVASTVLLLIGGVRLWRENESHDPRRRRTLLAGILVGAGAFQTYDGIVQHVFLHLHLVDEFVCADPLRNNSLATCPRDLPFEVGWIAVGIALLAAGVMLSRRRASRDGAPPVAA